MGMIGCLRAIPEEQLAELRSNPADIEVLLADEGEFEIDLDKAWHGLHFLFTGTAWEGEPPLCYLVTCGSQIGDFDVGYGPAHGITLSEVREFAAALDSLSPDELRRRFDPAKMNDLEIYPDIWGRDPTEDDGIGYLLENFIKLRGFVSGSARGGKALLFWIS